MKTVVGNWKMEVGTRESVALARGTLLALRGKSNLPSVVVCPPFVSLSEVRKVVARSSVALGAQNMAWEEKGAFTGEISPRMLEEHGVSHVILGHSERREYFGETDEMVNKKVLTAIGHGLIPIICVGENQEQRKAGETREVIKRQVTRALKDVSLRKRDKFMIAYEPIWAISTTKSAVPATPTDAVEIHSFIRELASSSIDGVSSDQFGVLYGGSVNDKNAYGFLRESEVDGVLVGGASVKMNQFSKVIAAAIDVMEGLSGKGTL